MIRRTAAEVYEDTCKTPLDSDLWPRNREDSHYYLDTALPTETAATKLPARIDPHTTHGPDGFMTRKLVADKDLIAKMQLQLPTLKQSNVASWLQSTPELAIEAALLRGFDTPLRQ